MLIGSLWNPRRLRVLAAVAVLILAGRCLAEEAPRSGGCKVWKLVKKEKTVTATCYGCKCKDIRLPTQGCQGNLITEKVTGGKEDCQTSPGEAKVTYSTDMPGGGRTRNVKQLIKYEVTKKVPVYVWELVDGCENPLSK